MYGDRKLILGENLIYLSLLISSTMARASICESRFSSPTLPLEHAQSVLADPPTFVAIDQPQIKRVAGVLDRAGYAMSVPPWNFPPYPSAGASFDQMFVYFLTLDAINYMYRDPQTGLTFGDDTMVGAGLNASRLASNLERLTTPGYLSNFDLTEASRLFAAVRPLPDLPGRVEHLRSVGRFLDSHPGEDWQKWLRQFPRAIDLARYIAQNVSGFDDPFLKRAQLFVGMLVGRFSAEVPPAWKGLEGMTVYADYILPMVMVRMGILDYAESLRQKLLSGETIVKNSREEVEIRASTLEAARLLLASLRTHARYHDLNVLALDAALWLQGKEIEIPGSEMPVEVFDGDSLPHHVTVTSDY